MVCAATSLRNANQEDRMPRRAKVSIVVCSAMFMAGLDLFIVNLAFPQIGREFHGTSLAALSWVLSAYAIVYAALLVPAGRFADRTGRRRSFLIGLSVFSVSSLACAAAPSIGFLIAGRVVQAAGAGLLIPPSLGLLLPEFPPERRQAAVGLWASAASGAAAAGPALGGLLTEVSWRLVFLVNVPVGLAAFVAGRRILRETREADGPRPDALGAAVLACGGARDPLTRGDIDHHPAAGPFRHRHRGPLDDPPDRNGTRRRHPHRDLRHVHGRCQPQHRPPRLGTHTRHSGAVGRNGPGDRPPAARCSAGGSRHGSEIVTRSSSPMVLFADSRWTRGSPPRGCHLASPSTPPIGTSTLSGRMIPCLVSSSPAPPTGSAAAPPVS